MSAPWGWTYYFFILCLSSFLGKVFEEAVPNLVCRIMGSVACLVLLLVIIAIKLTE